MNSQTLIVLTLLSLAALQAPLAQAAENNAAFAVAGAHQSARCGLDEIGADWEVAAASDAPTSWRAVIGFLSHDRASVTATSTTYVPFTTSLGAPAALSGTFCGEWILCGIHVTVQRWDGAAWQDEFVMPAWMACADVLASLR